MYRAHLSNASLSDVSIPAITKQTNRNQLLGPILSGQFRTENHSLDVDTRLQLTLPSYQTCQPRSRTRPMTLPRQAEYVLPIRGARGKETRAGSAQSREE